MKNVYKSLIAICLIVTVALGISSCKTNKMTESHSFGEIMKSDTIEMTIYQHKVDCVGVGPQKCLKVKFGDDNQWQYFYSEIKGFEHKEGMQYKILVRRDEMSNPPQDPSKYVYTFLELKSWKRMLGR